MKRLSGEDRAGLYITVIVHLTVIIVLLLVQINSALSKENTFVMDFSQQDEAEKVEKLRKEVEKEEQKKELISEKLDKMLADAGTPVRNVAVNRGALKDDRNTDADQLYKDAERLAEELESGKKVNWNKDDVADLPQQSKPKEEKQAPTKAYSGPSVLSYELDGRKASSLPIPAYRCYGAGEVTVIIGVDPSGKVVYAKVKDDVSSDDKCLRDFAIRAARGSRFSASSKAPAKQMGNIVYSFIAQ